MEQEIETIDSTNDEETTETTDSSTGEETEEAKEKYTEREKQYYSRIKVLEAKLKSDGTKELKQSKSDDFGYDVKAYLKASGIKSNEFVFVQEQLKTSGIKDVDSLLDNEYFQDKLTKHRELAKTAEATPTGKRSGGVATDSVEYWSAKPIEDVPADMRRKVVNAKLERETNRGKFYNS